ncbi:MAG TPA: DUF1778 domain-containing protein, partial [Candidatus Nanoarchaeia archaeon]|nr:DUF1778 domain-containing protein [Candidatus Nanoarchaeia archaeon]
MEPEELESFRNMKPVQIMVSARDYMQLQDAINNPSEPNEALKKAAQRFREGFTLRGRAFDPA